MKKDRTKDMTKGKPFPLIIKFMLPLLGSNIMQQLYTIVDTIIVGRGVGVEALAAVGATDMLRMIAVWGIAGFADGFGISMTLCFGQKSYGRLRQAKNISIVLAMGISAFVSVIGIVISTPILKATHVPANIFHDARTYIVIIYGGCMAMMLYNICSCILRAVGDSRTPFIGILLSSMANILLDLLFVFVFHWGLAGAAVATVLSQLLSAIYCLQIIRKISILHTNENFTETNFYWIKRLLKAGIPMAFQNSFIAIGGVILQSVINEYGSDFVAGFTATNKIYLLFEGAAIALGSTMMVYVGQNCGAGNYKRINTGIRFALLISLFLSVILCIILICSGKLVLSLFISADSATEQKILSIAYQYLKILCFLLFMLYLLHIYRNALMGLGNTTGPLGSGIAEFLCRITIALIFVKFIGQNALYFAESTAWIGADIVMIPAFYCVLKKQQKGAKIHEKG